MKIEIKVNIREYNETMVVYNTKDENKDEPEEIFEYQTPNTTCINNKTFYV
jgi:hypothetical protein